MPKTQSYDQAAEKLEAIVKSLEDGTLPLEETGAKVAEAQKLLDFCRSRLLKVEADVKKTLENNGEK